MVDLYKGPHGETALGHARHGIPAEHYREGFKERLLIVGVGLFSRNT